MYQTYSLALVKSGGCPVAMPFPLPMWPIPNPFNANNNDENNRSVRLDEGDRKAEEQKRIERRRTEEQAGQRTNNTKHTNPTTNNHNKQPQQTTTTNQPQQPTYPVRTLGRRRLQNGRARRRGRVVARPAPSAASRRNCTVLRGRPCQSKSIKGGVKPIENSIRSYSSLSS